MLEHTCKYLYIGILIEAFFSQIASTSNILQEKMYHKITSHKRQERSLSPQKYCTRSTEQPLVPRRRKNGTSPSYQGFFPNGLHRRQLITNHTLWYKSTSVRTHNKMIFLLYVHKTYFMRTALCEDGPFFNRIICGIEQRLADVNFRQTDLCTWKRKIKCTH